MKISQDLISEKITYLLFICINATFLLKITDNNTLPGIISICTIPFLLLRIRHLPVWIVCFILWMLIFYSLNPYGISNIIFYILVSVSLTYVNFNTILKANIFSTVLLFAVVIILNLIGYINDRPGIKPGGIAHDYGFQNANTLATYIIYTVISIYILYFNKKYILLFTIILITLVFYYITQCRSLLIVNSFLCITLILNIKIINSVITSKFTNIILILLIPFCIYIIIHQSIYSDINEVTSGRAMYMLELFNLMTKETIIAGMEKPEGIIVDNVYMLTFLFGGIIPLIIIVYRNYVILTTQRYAYKYNCVIFIVYIWGFVESCYLNPFISGTYLIWALLLGNKTIMRNENRSSLCDIRA